MRMEDIVNYVIDFELMKMSLRKMSEKGFHQNKIVVKIL
jgi:hypothetical protein